MESEVFTRDASDARLRSLVAPVIYGDVFDFPLTLGEWHRYRTVSMTREELGAEVREDERFARAAHHDGELYFLEGRDELIELRFHGLDHENTIHQAVHGRVTRLESLLNSRS